MKASYIGNKKNYICRLPILKNELDFSKGSLRVSKQTADILKEFPRTFKIEDEKLKIFGVPTNKMQAREDK